MSDRMLIAVPKYAAYCICYGHFLIIFDMKQPRAVQSQESFAPLHAIRS